MVRASRYESGCPGQSWLLVAAPRVLSPAPTKGDVNVPIANNIFSNFVIGDVSRGGWGWRSKPRFLLKCRDSGGISEIDIVFS